jgi:hypothetical protein
MTFATLLAETSRRRVAAFIPDTAIAEMLLTGLSLGGVAATMLTRPRNLSFTLAIKFERNSGGGVNDSAMDQSASSIEASIYRARESGGELVGRIMIRGY